MATSRFFLRELLEESPQVSIDGNGTTVVRTGIVAPREDADQKVIPQLCEIYPLIPATYSQDYEFNCYLTSTSISPVRGSTTYVVSFTFQSESLIQINPYKEIWSFDLAATQEHITSVVTSDNTFTLPTEAEDRIGTLIGLEKDRINGVDVYRPKTSINVTKWYMNLTTTQIQTLSSMTSTTNAQPWFVFGAQDVLFMGPKISQETNGLWRIDYQFVGGTHQSASFTLSSGETANLELAPHDYVWFEYEKSATTSDDGEASELYDQIKTVIVDQVYEQSDFSFLNLHGPGNLDFDSFNPYDTGWIPLNQLRSNPTSYSFTQYSYKPVHHTQGVNGWLYASGWYPDIS